MATGRTTSAMADLRTLFAVGRIGDRTDGELLDRFAGHRERDLAVAAAAFEALVRRHGPMVLAACRTLLRDPNDVEDAFQATFLVLVRKAGSIRDRGSLAGWLHRVARRIALRARVEADRRRAVEGRFPRESTTPGAAETVPERGELSAALHEEIDRLPAAFRAAIVLCHLEGRTHEEAAAQLCCPVGTVRSRLARGRDRLKAQLARRGWSSPSIAPLLSPEFPATVPAALREATLRTAARVLLGESAGSGLSPVAATLAGAALRGMALAQVKVAALAVVVACGLGGAGVLAVGGAAERGGGGAEGASPAQTPGPGADRGADDGEPADPLRGLREEHGVPWMLSRSEAREQARRERKPLLVFFAAVNDANSRQMARDVLGAESVVARLKDVVPLLAYTDVLPVDSLPPERRAELAEQNRELRSSAAPGAGDPLFIAYHPEGLPIGRVDGYTPVDRFVQFLDRALESERVEVHGVVRDTDGEPILGATVVVGIWEELITAGYDNHLWEAAPRPGGLVARTVQTDELGRFHVLTTAPTTGKMPFYVNVLAFRNGYSADCWRGVMEADPLRENVAEATGITLASDPRPYVGVVQTREGEPIAGAEVWIQAMQGPPPNSSTPVSRYAIRDVARGTLLEGLFLVRSDSEGRFQFPAVPPPYFVSMGAAAEGMADFHLGPYVRGTEEAPYVIRMRPEARVEGRVVSRVPGVEPSRQVVLAMQTVESLQGDQTPYGVDGRALVDADGRFVIDRLDAFGGIAMEILLEGRTPEDSWIYRATPSHIDLKPGETAEVTIEIIEGVEAEGVVRDERSREPLAGVRVSFHHGEPSASDFAFRGVSAETDAEGGYRLRVPPGVSRFFVARRRPGYVHLPNETARTVNIPEDVATFAVPAIELRPRSAEQDEEDEEDEEDATDDPTPSADLPPGELEDRPDVAAILQEASKAVDLVEPNFRDLALESLAAALAQAGEEDAAVGRAGEIGMEGFRRNALRRIEEARADQDPMRKFRLNLEVAQNRLRSGDVDASRRELDRAWEQLEALEASRRGWEQPIELARLSAALGDAARASRALALAAEGVESVQPMFYRREVLAGLAVAQAELGEDEAAREKIKTVLAADDVPDEEQLPDGEHARAVRWALAAQGLAALGDRAEAEALVGRVEQALAPALAGPEDHQEHSPHAGLVHALAVLATAQFKLGQVEAARANFQEAMGRIIPQNLRSIARGQAEAGDIEGAVANTMAVGGHPQALEAIAIVQAAAGDVDGALETIDLIPRSSWIHAGALAGVAKARATAGDRATADAIFGEARAALDALPDGHLKAQTAGSVLYILYTQARFGEVAAALEWARRQESAYVRARALTGIVEGILWRDETDRATRLALDPPIEGDGQAGAAPRDP